MKHFGGFSGEDRERPRVSAETQGPIATAGLS